MIDFKGAHFESTVIMVCLRWYLSYPISYRNLEEMMQDRGVWVDHSTLNGWVLRCSLEREAKFRKRKGRIGRSWRMDESYVRVKGQWKYLYRAVDKQGNTIDFLLTAKRDRQAAKRFLEKAVSNHGVPEKINIDKSGANAAGITDYKGKTGSKIKIRQVRYLNNIVEQDHRVIKRLTRARQSFKSFWSAAITLAGIEVLHMIRKRQMRLSGKLGTTVEQFYSLAA